MSETSTAAGWAFDHSFAESLPRFYVPAQAANFPKPRCVLFNTDLARVLGLDGAKIDGARAAAFFSGNVLPPGARPIALAYAGHQFGNFVPLLGDGRAMLLGELVSPLGRRDLALKGSGRTSFSRGGDGRAALGPVLREYVVSEAMHALGIPSTRALAAVTTGEQIWRPGANPGEQPGAVLTRVAISLIRVGSFELFAARGETAQVQRLADYVIARHYPAAAEQPQPYLALLQAVADAQAKLVAQWMAVGFVHGVMNTDNASIAGETLDFGPCAFMDAYHPKTVFSSIDAQGRYAYGNQPVMARWNLARLAQTLLPLIASDEDAALAAANAEIAAFPERYAAHWQAAFRAKLGLTQPDAQDAELIGWFLAILQAEQADFTLSFRALAAVLRGDAAPLRTRLHESRDFEHWLNRWQARLQAEGATGAALRAVADRMDAVNPLYIPRNHAVQAALDAAQAGDFAPVHALLAAVTQPFVAHADWAIWAQPPPVGAATCTTFCGT
jgi:uncharacterized protein YdiU (UPF0061 family)